MKETTKFTGFSQKTIQFLKDLKENNNKRWFDEHKHMYESELLNPLKALVTAMTPAMYAIDSLIDFRFNRVLSRIYRDIRFSLDKTPYKTHMWITYQRMVPEWQNFPAFFMEISEKGYRYGMGLYGSKKAIMDNFRSKIEYEQERFKEITQDLISIDGFSLEGEEYKRPLKNDLPEYFQPWFQRKSTYLLKVCPAGNEMFNNGFVQLLTDEFTKMKDLYEFFVDACE
jgi:uncharacterized protein (TIGR02453 family)